MLQYTVLICAFEESETWNIMEFLLPESLQMFWMSKGIVLNWGDVGKEALCKSGGSQNPSGAKDGIEKQLGALSLQLSGQSLEEISLHMQLQGSGEGITPSCVPRLYRLRGAVKDTVQNLHSLKHSSFSEDSDWKHKQPHKLLRSCQLWPKPEKNKQTNNKQTTTTTKKLLFKQLANPGYKNSHGCVSHSVQFPAWLRPSPLV